MPGRVKLAGHKKDFSFGGGWQSGAQEDSEQRIDLI